jgi:hypothetical protein
MVDERFVIRRVEAGNGRRPRRKEAAR